MNWIERVKISIFPRSIEKQNIRSALDEWFYTGETIDLEYPDEDCELCGHNGIRYQFAIQNRHTKKELLIGSECITKFDISAIGSNGEILNRKDTAKKVQKDRNKLIKEAKKRRLINTLVVLASKEENFDINSFISYFDERGAFTPNQLKTLFWRLEKHQISYKKSDFKITIRRNREKEQLLDLEDWQIEQIWGCMSSTQRKFYTENKDYDPSYDDKRLEELAELARNYSPNK